MAKKNPPTEDQIREMQRYYDETGSMLRTVADKFGWEYHTVSKYLVHRKDKSSVEQRRQKRIDAVTRWRRNTKEKLVEYKGGKCKVCGYDKCIDALEFHHRDPSKKDFSISGKTWSYEKLQAEVDKCDLVCSNCHRELHNEQKISLVGRQISECR